MSKQRSAADQAILDLDTASTQILLEALKEKPLDSEKAQQMSNSIRNASQVLQRTLSRIKRIASEGVAD